MTPELIAILAVGAAIVGVVLNARCAARKDIGDLRAELNAKIDGIRTEIGNLRAELNAKIDGIRTEIGNLRERMARLEGLLEGLREAISGRRDTA